MTFEIQSQNIFSIYVEDVYTLDKTNLDEFSINLKQKLTSLLNEDGINSNLKSTEYYIIPKLTFNTNHVGGALKQSLNVDGQLSFYLVNMFSGSIINSVLINIRGTGDDINKALISSIKNIRNNNSVSTFIRDISSNVANHEETVCSEIKTCYNLVLKGELNKAIELLNTLDDKNCISQKLFLTRKIIEVDTYNQCKVNYQEGKLELAKGNYDCAVNSLIKVNKSCTEYFDKSEALINQILNNKRIDKIYKSDIEKLKLENERADNESKATLSLKEKEWAYKLESLKSTNNGWQFGSLFLDILK